MRLEPSEEKNIKRETKSSIGKNFLNKVKNILKPTNTDSVSSSALGLSSDIGSDFLSTKEQENLIPVEKKRHNIIHVDTVNEHEHELNDIKILRTYLTQFIADSTQGTLAKTKPEEGFRKEQNNYLYAERLLTVTPNNRIKDLENLFKTPHIDKNNTTKLLLQNIRNIQKSCDDPFLFSLTTYSKSANDSLGLFGINDRISTMPVSTSTEKDMAIKTYKKSTQEVLKFIKNKIEKNEITPTEQDKERIVKLIQWSKMI